MGWILHISSRSVGYWSASVLLKTREQQGSAGGIPLLALQTLKLIHCFDGKKELHAPGFQCNFHSAVTADLCLLCAFHIAEISKVRPLPFLSLHYRNIEVLQVLLIKIKIFAPFTY